MLADALPFLIFWLAAFVGGCVLVAIRDKQDQAEAQTRRATTDREEHHP